MKTLTTRYYYTLKEVFEAAGLTCNLDVVGDDEGLGEILSDMYADDLYDPDTWSGLDDSINKVMFQQYLWGEFKDEVVIFIDVDTSLWEEPTDPEDSDILDAFEEKATKIMKWYQDSNSRYSTLIATQESIASDLMAKIGSTSTTLYNDTPQNGGDFTSDPYTTNATLNTVEADAGTPIARLKEIEGNIRNYYSDWADEFSRFVIYSA